MRLVLVFVALWVTITNAQEFCASERKQYRLHGDRTFYDVVAGKLPKTSNRAPQDCVPIQIYMIVRHGARYPGASNLPTLRKILRFAGYVGEAGKPTMCRKDLQGIKDWKVYTDEYDQRNQTKKGANEVKGIARRFKQLFPEILGSNVNVNKFGFRSTHRTQTMQSLDSFKNEMLSVPNDTRKTWNRRAQATVYIPPWSKDPIISSSCKKYAAQKTTNRKQYTIESTKFGYGRLISRIMDNVARRLGIRRYRIYPSLLNNIYTLGCRYQQQVDGFNGPWCKLFSTYELKVLKYWDDLLHYEILGPKMPISIERDCVFAKDIISLMTSSRDRDMTGRERPAAKFFSVHTTQIATMAQYFGLVKVNIPLTHSNYLSQGGREFDLSKIVPTGGNLVFVLYRCPEKEYKMQLYFNENLVRIPGCPEDPNSLCSLNRILELYPHLVVGSENECNQEEICGPADLAKVS